MRISQIKKIKTQDEARQFAIDWQAWAWDRSLYYSELKEWTAELRKLAEKFELVEEFEENAII